MEMHKCKLCLRKFMCGRALGGHMARSHFTKLPIPHKIFQERKVEKVVEVTESASTELKGVAYVLRENPRKSFKVIDPEFFDASSVVVQNRETESGTETETESEVKLTRGRSEKGKRMMQDGDDDDELVKNEFTESMSELSYVASDEDVALFLLMLSRGEFKLGVKHRCEVCNKVFKSSQALGGHRVSHKNVVIKKSLKRNAEKKQRNSEARSVGENKVHECPHCGRLFGSGQALGGHKRSHFLNNPSRRTIAVTTASCSSNVGESLVVFSNSEKNQDGLFDLNFPAPMDDDYDDGFSHQEASAVSEAD